MSKCSFVSKLTEEQLKELTYLCLLECDKLSHTHYLYEKGLDDVTINNLSKDEDKIKYSSISYDNRPFSKFSYTEDIYHSNFCLDDFEMIMSDGKWQIDLSSVLHIYLASVFDEEYLQALMNKRINDAINEKISIENSIGDYSTIINNLKKENNKEKVKNRGNL